jgi:hypothetical protein
MLVARLPPGPLRLVIYNHSPVARAGPTAGPGRRNFFQEISSVEVESEFFFDKMFPRFKNASIIYLMAFCSILLLFLALRREVLN